MAPGVISQTTPSTTADLGVISLAFATVVVAGSMFFAAAAGFAGTGSSLPEALHAGLEAVRACQSRISCQAPL